MGLVLRSCVCENIIRMTLFTATEIGSSAHTQIILDDLLILKNILVREPSTDNASNTTHNFFMSCHPTRGFTASAPLWRRKMHRDVCAPRRCERSLRERLSAIDCGLKASTAPSSIGI